MNMHVEGGFITEPKAEDDYDAMFNPLLNAKSEGLKAITADVVADIESKDKRKRRRKAKYQHIFEITTEAVICNLIRTKLKPGNKAVAVTQSNWILGSGNSADRPLALNQQLPKIIEMLAAEPGAWLTLEPGYKNDFARRRTLIRPSMRLLALIASHEITLRDMGRHPDPQTIILKEPNRGKYKGKRLPLPDTPETRRMKSQMEAINSFLNQAQLEFDEGAQERDEIIDTQQRSLRRVFNGSLTSGGRMWGGFWMNLSSEERLEGIAIGGEEVAYLDYGQIGPHILYGIEGVKPPMEDLYNIPGLTDWEGFSYRAGVKKVLSSLTFKDALPTRKPKETKRLLPPMSMTEIVELIQEAHPAIAKHFGTQIGFTVQYHESEIMVEVMTRLNEEGIVCLPIHDGMLIPKSQAEYGANVMGQVFNDRYGFGINIGVEI